MASRSFVTDVEGTRHFLENREDGATRTGVKLPIEVERSITQRRYFRGNIAAIDFGTTCCSLAYALQAENCEVKFVKLDNDDTRAPTSILIDAEGEVIAFGKMARKKYSSFQKEKQMRTFHFHRIKMDLQHDKDVSINNKVKATNGTEFFLVDVIAQILKYIKNRLLSIEVAHRPTKITIEASNFDWVITVPAIWKARGKQMMREAAYKAGIASSCSEVRFLPSGGAVANTSLCITASTVPASLSLALEPEAAALYCSQIAKAEEAQCANTKGYMVLDIGGGTVDISAHKVLDSNAVEVLLPPTGNNYGGTRVNDEFRKYLGKLARDEKFERYLSESVDNHVKNSADLDAIINQKFEDQKQFFGDCSTDMENIAVIELPSSFMKTYETDIKKETLEKEGTCLDEDDLSIPYAIMEDFFSPVVKGIIECVLTSLNQVATEIDTVFVVGGFGGCNYIYEKIEAAVKKRAPKCNVYRPSDHKLAIVSGAITFRRNPEIVRARVVDATYGSGCSILFRTSMHNELYSFRDDDNKKMCNSLFLPFVKKGDIVSADKVLTTTYLPLKHNQTISTFGVYSSNETQVDYIVKPDGQPLPGVIQIGKVSVAMPDTTGDKSRETKLTFDFMHTEIQIEAYDVTSGKKGTTTVDFLSDL